jgi:hypothetical protein
VGRNSCCHDELPPAAQTPKPHVNVQRHLALAAPEVVYFDGVHRRCADLPHDLHSPKRRRGRAGVGHADAVVHCGGVGESDVGELHTWQSSDVPSPYSPAPNAPAPRQQYCSPVGLKAVEAHGRRTNVHVLKKLKPPNQSRASREAIPARALKRTVEKPTGCVITVMRRRKILTWLIVCKVTRVIRRLD